MERVKEGKTGFPHKYKCVKCACWRLNILLCSICESLKWNRQSTTFLKLRIYLKAYQRHLRLVQGSMCEKQLNVWKHTVQLSKCIQQLHRACECNGRHIETHKSTFNLTHSFLCTCVLFQACIILSPKCNRTKSPWIVVHRIFSCIMCEFCNIICQQWWCPSDRAVLIQVINRSAKTMINLYNAFCTGQIARIDKPAIR